MNSNELFLLLKDSPKKFLEVIKNESLEITYEDLRNNKPSSKHGQIFTPKKVMEFIAAYYSGKKISAVLDPVAGIGDFLDFVASKVNIKKAVGISTPGEIELAAILATSNIEWHPNYHNEIPLSADKYDLIIGFPPITGVRTSKIFNVGQREIEVRDEPGLLMMLEACSALTFEGKAFFLVTPRFFIDSKKNSVRDTLTKLGLFIDAAFYLPSGMIEGAGVATYLIVITRDKPEKLFLGELNNVQEIQDLLKHWDNRIEAKVPSIGMLVDIEDFRSYTHEIKSREAIRLARRAGLDKIFLKEIALEINLCGENLESGFEQKANSIYLPLMNYSQVVSSLADLQVKPQHYVQLVLNPQKANSDYVAHFLNTDLGRTIRESMSFEFTIARLKKSDLENALIYLPLYDKQINIIEIQNQISNLKAQLNSIENELWQYPLKHDNVQKSLNKVNQNESIEQWIDKLPFPIASILRLYHATVDEKDKVEHLLNFFEALTQFIFTILLSAIMTDKDFFEKEKHSGADLDKLAVSSFGSWLRISEQFAKTVRRELSSKNADNRERCMSMFRRRRTDLIEMLTTKKLFQVLNVALSYRNDWKGHGGVTSKKEANRRKVLLENELHKIRDIIGDGFDNTLLIRPESSELIEGVFHYRVHLLKGSQTIFKEEVINSTISLDSSKLYLLEDGHSVSLELKPFIRLMPSPSTEENACYFYNRIDKDGTRWISYHFDKKPEEYTQDNTIKSIISLLKSGPC